MQNGIERGLTTILYAIAAGTTAHALPQAPDVIVYDVAVSGSDTDDIAYYGQSGGIAAYSMATQSCNQGTIPLDWYSSDNRHPVIGQNMFRYKDGHFEQLGYSWLKHGFCAVSETEAFCAPCLPDAGCDELGVGCADTYWSTLNDGGSGRSKRFVNATLGSHVENGLGPSGVTAIRGRLQVAVADIDPTLNPGAEYFIEGQYVTADDAAAGASGNNCSWRRVVVNSVTNLVGGGPTNREQPAIQAWRVMDSGVTVRTVFNPEVPGYKALYMLGYRVTQTGPSTWHYEYALQNLTSDQSVDGFTVQVAPGVTVSNIGFHDVNAHSGDPYDTTDWPGVRNAGNVDWATTPFDVNPNANALRWGTLYNFRFDADSPPANGMITLGLFKPGPLEHLSVRQVLVPDAPPIAFDKFQPHGDPTAEGSAVAPFVRTRNGGNINPQVFFEESAAVVGGTWKGRVDTHEPSLLLVSLAGPAQGRMTRMGELLIRTPFTRQAANDGPSLSIPSDPALVGATFSAQAATLSSDGWRLTNALDVTVGAADAP